MKKDKQLPKSMTPELWALYRLIETATNEGRTLKVSEICSAFPDRYHLNAKECNYSNCKELYEDIYIINTVFTHEHDKYIITNANKIKLATKVEIQKEYRKILQAFKRLNAKRKALKKVMETNNQYKLLSNQNVPIDENSNAKPYVESYSDK
jgi:hypothetical protein